MQSTCHLVIVVSLFLLFSWSKPQTPACERPKGDSMMRELVSPAATIVLTSCRRSLHSHLARDGCGTLGHRDGHPLRSQQSRYVSVQPDACKPLQSNHVYNGWTSPTSDKDDSDHCPATDPWVICDGLFPAALPA